MKILDFKALKVKWWIECENKGRDRVFEMNLKLLFENIRTQKLVNLKCTEGNPPGANFMNIYGQILWAKIPNS